MGKKEKRKTGSKFVDKLKATITKKNDSLLE